MKSILLYFIIMQIVHLSAINYNYNIFRNTCLRLIVFKKKVSVQLVHLCKSYDNYNRKLELLNLLMYNYNSLSEDDKTIIETILSLCI